MIKIRHIPTSNNPAAILVPMITFSETEKIVYKDDMINFERYKIDIFIIRISDHKLVLNILGRDIEIQHTCTDLSISLKSYETFTTVSSI